MKKFARLALISTFLAALTAFTGCSDPTLRETADWTADPMRTDRFQSTDAQPPDSVPDSLPSHLLDYDEIMKLPVRYEGVITDQPSYDDLDDLLLSMEQIGVPASLVCGTVTQVHYYLSWDKSVVSAYTLSTFSVTAVDPAINGTGLSVGDTIQIYETYSVRYAKASEELRYFAEQSGQELPKKQWAVLEPGVVEVFPISGAKMTKSFAYENWVEIPMKAGESYTFCIRKNPIEVTGVENSYIARGIACVGMSDPAAFYKQADLNMVDDLRRVADEILERFDTSAIQDAGGN